MKNVIQLLALFLIIQFGIRPAFAQSEFAKVYYQAFQELQSGAVAACFDGSFVIAGERDAQYFLLKTDATGDTI